MTNAQPMSLLREEDLVDMAITGSREAFGELSRRHRDKLHAHLYFRTSSDDDADDLTQEVLCKAWAAIGRFKRTDSPFVAWLLTIARNLLVDRARAGKAAREVSFVHPVSAGWEGRDDDMDASLGLADTDRMADPEAVCLLREEAARVRGALATMGERHPERHFAVALRYLDGYEYRNIAPLMGRTEGCARVIVHRGIGELRARLLAREVPLDVA